MYYLEGLLETDIVLFAVTVFTFAAADQPPFNERRETKEAVKATAVCGVVA